MAHADYEMYLIVDENGNVEDSRNNLYDAKELAAKLALDTNATVKVMRERTIVTRTPLVTYKGKNLRAS